MCSSGEPPICLPFRVSEEEARAIIAPGESLASRIVAALRGPWELKRLERVWLPIHVFGVTVRSDGQLQESLLSIDALEGIPAWLPPEVSLLLAERGETAPARLAAPPGLTVDEAHRIAQEHSRRQLFERAVRGTTRASFGEVRILATVGFPFWVGYLARRGVHEFQAVDGLSGALQGGAMRRPFLKAFRRRGSDPPAGGSSRE